MSEPDSARVSSAPGAAERLPWHWVGAAAGVLAGLVDVAVMLQFGVEMRVGGVDATAGVLAFLAANYAVVGYAIGRSLQGRARARRDAETISRQLRELERAQHELVQQEKLAAIGRVAAGVAHEVRNPLGVIRASAAMVQESFAPRDDAYRACEFICQEIDRLNALIAALLSFSRPTELRRHTVSIEHGGRARAPARPRRAPPAAHRARSRGVAGRARPCARIPISSRR